MEISTLNYITYIHYSFNNNFNNYKKIFYYIIKRINAQNLMKGGKIKNESIVYPKLNSNAFA